jgi:immune inhibitor A
VFVFIKQRWQDLRQKLPKTFLFFLFFLLTWYLNSSAVSLTPEVVEKLRSEGRLQEWIDQWKSAAQRGMYESTPAQLTRLAKRSSVSVDTLKPLVLCVDFSDNPQTFGIDTLAWLLFSRDFTVPSGSFRDYYLENSYGKHDPQGGVYGWIRAPQTYDYYTNGNKGLGGWPHNSQKLVQDALELADPFVNFADYDYDGDGWIDGLMIVHAGPGAEETGDDWDIWSHRWAINTQERDGIYISSYTMQPEKHATGALTDIGVFCHEWGHDLGIHWEEYDEDYSTDGLGNWSVMAMGCFNDGGKTPAHHSAYCKYVLGWTEVVTVSSNLTGVEIVQAETSPVSYRLWTSGYPANEYFMVENRQKTGFDSHLPGGGLLIYHVDVHKDGNNEEWCPGDPGSFHLKTAIEQADGLWELENCPDYPNPDRGDGNDPFPGFLVKRAFDDTTTPSSRDYYDNSTQVAVWNISDSDSVIYANLDVIWSRPNLALGDFHFDDDVGGDGDGRPEPNEIVELYFSVSNTWKSLSGAWVVASVDTEGITFSIDSVNLGDISSGGSADNYGNPIEFNVATGFPTKKVDFTLRICGDGGESCVDLISKENVGSTEILVVDDDDHTSGSSDYIDYYQAMLDSSDEVYDIWDKQAKSSFSVELSTYSILIWFTGDHRDSIFSIQELQDLMDYLDGGGRLFLTSQDAVEVLSGSAEIDAQTFLSDYLHLGYNGTSSKYLVVGRTGDQIGDGLHIYPNYQVANQTSKDNLVPDSEADTVLYYTIGGAGGWWAPSELVAGTKFQNGLFGVVVFGFGLESVRSDGAEFHGEFCSKPHVVMQRILSWFRTGSHVGVVTLDSSSYHGTDNQIEVTVMDPDLDADPAQADTVSVKITSSSDQTGIFVLCTETGKNSATFSGSCGFTTGLSDDLHDSISVSDKDTVFAVYADQSPPGERMAKAVWIEDVDAEPPTFTVGILQNPMFSAELNIYAIASESLQSVPLIIIQSDTLEVQQISFEGTVIYSCNYTLSNSGNIQIKVTGTDYAGNPGSHTEDFAAGLILTSGGVVVSHDGILHLDVGSGAVKKTEFFLVFMTDDESGINHIPEDYLDTYSVKTIMHGGKESDGEVISATYSITPSQTKLGSKAKLSFHYGGIDLEGRNPTGLAIHHWDGEAHHPIASFLDSDKAEVTAFIDKLGIYQLVYKLDQNSANVPKTHLLKDNYPNPFNSSTSIGYETSSPGWVRIEIYNLLGQKVRILVNEYQPAGRYTTIWDGADEHGQVVSSGIYFCRFSINQFAQTKKMVFLK